jgi:hypothetical protein
VVLEERHMFVVAELTPEIIRSILESLDDKDELIAHTKALEGRGAS